MRAKYIYEKFAQESDPVKDMGIGDLKKIYKKPREEFGKMYPNDITKKYFKEYLYVRNTHPLNPGFHFFLVFYYICEESKTPQEAFEKAFYEEINKSIYDKDYKKLILKVIKILNNNFYMNIKYRYKNLNKK